MANKVFKKVTPKINQDYDYMTINDKHLTKSQLFANNYIKTEIKKYIDFNLNYELTVDLSEYFKTPQSCGHFVCKVCLLKEDNELNFYKHFLRHFSDNKSNTDIDFTRRQSLEMRRSESPPLVVNEERVQTENTDNDWQVLDEWNPHEEDKIPEEEEEEELDYEVIDIVSTSDDSTNCSEALRRLSSSLSNSSEDIPQNEGTSGEPMIKRRKSGAENGSALHSCQWFDCKKAFKHRKCYEKHFDKHFVDKSGHKWEHNISDYSETYFTFNQIENYIEIIEENDIEKYFCKYSDCNYETQWSYQLVIHIRSEHTSQWPPFRCDWKDCHKIVPSKEAFAHRITHFE